MAKSIDPDALQRYRNVLLQLGHVAGYILWKKLPLNWIGRELPNFTARGLVEEMQRHVMSGGKIDQVAERRPEFTAYRFHYDLRLPMTGRTIYVESVLIDAACVEDCTIWVVNIHDA